MFAKESIRPSTVKKFFRTVPGGPWFLPIGWVMIAVLCDWYGLSLELFRTWTEVCSDIVHSEAPVPHQALFQHSFKAWFYQILCWFRYIIALWYDWFWVYSRRTKPSFEQQINLILLNRLPPTLLFYDFFSMEGQIRQWEECERFSSFYLWLVQLVRPCLRFAFYCLFAKYLKWCGMHASNKGM